ncbi:MAG: alpha/beta fold hydrolase, partial [Endozoicomonas sp.]
MSQSSEAPPIVLISGWAMPAMAMESLATALDKGHRRVSVIELPGLVQVGDSAGDQNIHWEGLLTYLDQQLFEKPAVLVGWSMGGVLASLYASRHPGNVAAVVNLATNACFVKNAQWTAAMAPELFFGFQAGVSKHCLKTLQQFTLLCSVGSINRYERAKALQSLLRDIQAETELELGILQALLTLLGSSDIRSALADICCPVSHILGQDDA